MGGATDVVKRLTTDRGGGGGDRRRGASGSPWAPASGAEEVFCQGPPCTAPVSGGVNLLSERDGR